MPKPSSLLPGYTWEPDTGRYRGANGRFVSRARIMDLLGDAINANERAMVRTVTAYHEGVIDQRTWAADQTLALKREYLQNAALGAGGWDRLTPRDYGRIGGKLRVEYGRIANLAEQIAAGEVTLPQALNRVHMEQGGAHTVFYETERAHLPPAPQGMNRLERRLLAPVENCEDCIAYYEQGWAHEGALPVPGEASRCLTNCRCSLIQKMVPANETENWIGTKG